ncbi:hemin uptake protein HemP [Aquabacterium sp.]|uniref:hemin uptake protein HemP n=1 Tax=Aquabacterium sp. TaxID=1872578 RepID=UPI002D80251F|nr:hemin uptake protein HemP [Aquabacterium sp.]
MTPPPDLHSPRTASAHRRQDPHETPAAADTAGLCKPRLHSSALFGGTDEIEIAHGDALYRLRITSLGKLILTK